MKRVHVVGTTGSGKTTLTGRLAATLGATHVELDGLYWGPSWTPTPDEEFRRRVAEALSGDTWVVDGNYSRVREVVWSRAEGVVWLDYTLAVIMRRLVRRTIRRSVERQELWNGNRERLIEHVVSRDSLFLWALRTYWRRKREYPAMLSRPEHAHLRVVRLHAPSAADEWLKDVVPTWRRPE